MSTTSSVQRRLAALRHPLAQSFDHQDEGAFRNLVSALEDSTIRFYKMEERGPLRDIQSDTWSDTFQKYLEDMECPFASKDWRGNDSHRYLVVDWLLGRAVALDYHDNADTFNSESAMARGKASVGIDVHSHEARAALKELAKLLQLPLVEDDNLMWRAVAKRVARKFSPEAITAARDAQQEVVDRHTLEEMPLGFSTGDAALDDAAKVLRLLHVSDLRDLQTRVNELITAAQNVTADPKTDSSLARVGK
ncbi:hypothetical protein PTSG_05115 [Salpingoeca rosetta]|uniref:Uncharacterized protein n=1 Tax=Salpingoeca rosetta (strain ATCC 50818 / BSB-021) TaxID=946362 RepID=F2UAK0_SALR5|nr:uncharacterized protein PTSG_05115 [Salpingoeca rosetta]EGD73416.1 hypothetical protein PTSG_05115 [Salpingoeca rosetta]|eukprot:XP_004993698.1 hypothetical protein PTSG_05115 [Salpingoeca rosetta]